MEPIKTVDSNGKGAETQESKKKHDAAGVEEVLTFATFNVHGWHDKANGAEKAQLEARLNSVDQNATVILTGVSTVAL